MPEALRLPTLDLAALGALPILADLDPEAGPPVAAMFLAPEPNEHPAWLCWYVRDPFLNGEPERIEQWFHSFAVALFIVPMDAAPYVTDMIPELTWLQARATFVGRAAAV